MYCLELLDCEGNTLLSKYNKSNQFKILFNCFIKIEKYVYNSNKNMNRFAYYGKFTEGTSQEQLCNNNLI